MQEDGCARKWHLVVGGVEAVRVREGQAAMRVASGSLDEFVAEALEDRSDIERINLVLTYAGVPGARWKARKGREGWLNVYAVFDARGISRADLATVTRIVELVLAEVLVNVLAKYKVPHFALKRRLDDLIEAEERLVSSADAAPPRAPSPEPWK